MSKLSLCAATALSLAACTCAVATPITIATNLRLSRPNDGRNYRDFDHSLCPGYVCDTSLTSLAGGSRKLAERNLTAMFWWEEGLAAHRVAWSGEMLGPFITIDFGSTVNVRSRTVWAESAPSPGEGSGPDEAPIAGTTFASPPKLNRSGRAYGFSGPNLIGNSVDVKFSQAPSNWEATRKASFNGATGSNDPRPATGLLVAGILVTVGSLRRKRLN